MTVLGALLQRSNIEDATQPLTSTVLGEWLGGYRSDSGVVVNERRVLGLPAYYRGLAIKGGTLAALPIKIYKLGTRERVRAKTVLDNPNPRQTPFEFWFTMWINAISWGNCYARKLRDGSDTVRQVWPIHPRRVRMEEVIPSEANPQGKVFWVTNLAGVEEKYTSWDIFHVPYMSSDGVVGIPPMHVFRQSLGLAIAGDDSAASFFANGSRITGVLQTDKTLDNDAARRLKARWKELTAGPQRAGEIAVLDNGATFKAIAIPPADAKLLESRKWSVEEISRMIGIPPNLVYNMEPSTSWGPGIENQVLGWVKFDIHQWLVAGEQRITRELLPGGWSSGSWYAEFDIDGLLRGDSKNRANFWHHAIADGWLNRNEVRSYENLEAADGLDEFIVPSNMTLVSVNGELVPVGTDPTDPTGN